MKIKWLMMVLAVVLAFPAVASASTITADLVYSNVLPDGILYGRVTVDSIAWDKVRFNVDMFTPPLEKGGKNFGIHKFGFNTDPDFQIDRNHKLVFSGPSDWWFSEDKSMDGFGKFDIRYQGDGNESVDPLIFSLQYKTRINNNSAWVYQSLSPEYFFDENSKGFHFAVCCISR